jgi:hypothetical protein
MWESLLAWLKERSASPLYGTYIITNILYNWRFYFTLFLQDQNALSIPKIEYVQDMFLSGNPILHICWFFLPPILLTLVIIKYMPRLTNWAYDISIKDDFSRKLSYDAQKLEYERKQKNILNQFLQIKQEKADTQEKIEEITSQEDRWNQEYKEFKKIKAFTGFASMLRAVYTSGGYIRNNDALNINPDIIAVSDSRGLISFIDEGRIALTEKGKYFAQRFFDDGLTLEEFPF